MEEFEERFIKPIVNATYPGTLAALSLTVLQVTGLSGQPTPFALRITLLMAATTFLLSALSIFSYSLYPTRKKIWTATALTFLFGLLCSIFSVFLLLIL